MVAIIADFIGVSESAGWSLAAIFILFVALALAFFGMPARQNIAWRLVWRGYWPVIGCVVLLTVMAVFVIKSAITADTGSEFYRTFMQGAAASLVEDVVFFSIVGFLIFVLQRREVDNERGLDDKIGLMFSGKVLRNGEMEYLKKEIKDIAFDCKDNFCEINVIDYDASEDLIKLDIIRRFYVGNYLSGDTCNYKFKINIAADDIASKSPALHMYPTKSVLVVSRDGAWTPAGAGDDEEIAPERVFGSGEHYVSPETLIQIAPGEVREFRMRFVGWQRLYAPRTAVGLGADIAGQSDQFCLQAQVAEPYEQTLLKHWDMTEFKVSNVLTRPLRVTISCGQTRKDFELGPGEEQRGPFRLENLPADSKVCIELRPN